MPTTAKANQQKNMTDAAVESVLMLVMSDASISAIAGMWLSSRKGRPPRATPSSRSVRAVRAVSGAVPAMP